MADSNCVLPAFENDEHRLQYLKVFGANRYLQDPIKKVCNVLKKFDKDLTKQVQNTKKEWYLMDDYEIAMLIDLTLFFHEEHQSNFLHVLQIIIDTQDDLNQKKKKMAKVLFNLFSFSYKKVMEKNTAQEAKAQPEAESPEEEIKTKSSEEENKIESFEDFENLYNRFIKNPDEFVGYRKKSMFSSNSNDF